MLIASVSQVCEAAVQANVDVLVLCDTNGGSLPWEVKTVLMCCPHFLCVGAPHVESCDAPCVRLNLREEAFITAVASFTYCISSCNSSHPISGTRRRPSCPTVPSVD